MNRVERTPEEIREALQQMKELQVLDLEILQLRQQLGVLLPKMPALEARLAQERQAVEQTDVSVDHTRERHTLEKEIHELETEIERHRKRQMDVKTNKEYAAVGHEMDALRKKIDGLETRVLELIDDEESHERRRQETRRRFEQLAVEAAEERRRIEEQIRTKKTKLEARAAEHERMRRKIPADVLRLYDRLSERHPGTVVVEAVRAHCGGCHMVLVSQKMVQIRQMSHFVRCEGCLRLFRGEAAEE